MASSLACSSKFLDALEGNNRGRPPVWMMRQAGRYLPEYQQLRTSRSLYDMFHDPKTACEVTLQPIRRFGLDAAILFADILLILECLGLKPCFPPEGGARVDGDLNNLQPNPHAVDSVFETIRLLIPKLDVPLIGFAGGPFTVATYAIEEMKKRAELPKTKGWLYRDPASFHELLEKITAVTITYLKGQIECGARAIQLFDSWAGILAPVEFEAFSLHYLSQIVEALRPTPVIIFCRGSSHYAEQIAAIAPAGISLDWGRPVHEVRRLVGPDITLQGNLDPAILKAPPDEVRARTRHMLDSMRNDPAYIAGLGHGMLPDIPLSGAHAFVETVQNYE